MPQTRAKVHHASRQAIETRYLGPTNYRGARIVAVAPAGRLVISWDHELSVDENHAKAAQLFADRYNWGGSWVGGGTRTGQVFVPLAKRGR